MHGAVYSSQNWIALWPVRCGTSFLVTEHGMQLFNKLILKLFTHVGGQMWDSSPAAGKPFFQKGGVETHRGGLYA